MMISLEYGVNLYSRESLLIFDEVQSFPRAREVIKHLIKDGRYDYIETGSLISIRENTKNILIPSEEKLLQMYPMDFEEFLWALGEEKMIDYIKQCCNDKKPLLNHLHKKAMFLFKQYLLVGGMPKVLSAYLDDNKQFENVDEEKHRNDIEIDFIIISGDKTNVKISPIEVKSSKKYTTISLEKFNSLFKKE